MNWSRFLLGLALLCGLPLSAANPTKGDVSCIDNKPKYFDGEDWRTLKKITIVDKLDPKPEAKKVIKYLGKGLCMWPTNQFGGLGKETVFSEGYGETTDEAWKDCFDKLDKACAAKCRGKGIECYFAASPSCNKAN